MSEDNHYVSSLRTFIQSEFRAEVRDKSAVVLDCLVCKHKPSPNCRVCHPHHNSKTGDAGCNKTKKFSGYASATHFHNVGKTSGSVASGNHYVDLAGEAISEQTINANKQAKQLRKMQDIVTGLRENVQRLELEKAETVDALKQVTFVCSNMRNRQKHLDMQLQRAEESLQQSDHRQADLEAQLRGRDEEIRDLKVRCANSEACRSNATKELRLLRQQLQKQTEHMSLFSMPTYRASGNQMSTLTNADLKSRQPRSFFFSSAPSAAAECDAMADFQADVDGDYEEDEDEDYELGANSPGGGCGQGLQSAASWRSARSGDTGAYDARDSDTVTSNTTSNTMRTTGTSATNNTTPMHSLRNHSQRANLQGREVAAGSQAPSQVEQVAAKIDPRSSGIGNRVLTGLVKGFEPNELIKQNNISKYAVGEPAVAVAAPPQPPTSREAAPLDVAELSDGERERPFQPDTRMTAQLVRGRSPQEMIKANNLARYRANILPSSSR
jgi:hypothetical protein